MHALKAAARARWVAGVDRGPRIARHGAPGGPRARRRQCRRLFLAADLEQGLPVRSASFDTVICLDLLEHVVERDRLLGEIRRVLKPGGVLLLAVPNRATSWKRRLARAGLFAYSDPDHKIEYTLEELRGELRRSGFHIVRDAHGGVRHAAHRHDRRRGEPLAHPVRRDHGGAPPAGADAIPRRARASSPSARSNEDPLRHRVLSPVHARGDAVEPRAPGAGARAAGPRGGRRHPELRGGACARTWTASPCSAFPCRARSRQGRIWRPCAIT